MSQPPDPLTDELLLLHELQQAADAFDVPCALEPLTGPAHRPARRVAYVHGAYLPLCKVCAGRWAAWAEDSGAEVQIDPL